ncbi:hypothetical protein PPERSA_09797 [Pseudocohnilembus persalinus]|uniref:Uncharacterized protein n=1 Tax=Pseudocohnilembus persalinus TaxID=266149 RepID=A0A0V0QTD3_PSEPJ|nr:hypothetical protein PPERSA_09797 [Pseudocohnilembus persalinus]|eukprot:KRX05657.1 hypothetical protein PPERSA_09797 [Pseudocohnilembus persalinus]
MQDIQILGSAIRKIFKACRKYYMYKRLKIRRDYKDRGTEIEDDFQKREQELTQNQLRFQYRCVATNQGQPFIKLEIYNNILEKSFIFIGRELKKLRIIQKIALNWNLLPISSIRVKLRYYTDAVFENYVQKEIRLDEEKQYQKKKQQALNLNSKKHQKNIEKNETLLDFLLKRMYLNDTETKFEFNLDISNQQILEEESAIKMLHYNQKNYNRNLFKFNTFYKQKERLQIKTQMDQEELDPLKEQHPTVQLNVDLNALPDLKKKIKLYGSKQQALKEVADQFVNGIKLNKQGSIILDSSNIDPNFVQISEQNLKKVVKRSQLVNTKKSIKTLQNMLDKEQIKRFTKILNKGIKMDSRKKFLLVEVPLKSIKNISADNVFSKAERIFVIDARTIDNSQQFDWKMSTEEYEKLTQEPNWELAAKKLITMIHLADQRVIIELFDDSVKIEDFQDKPDNIVIISKPKVLIMQQQLRKTRFQIKFRRHQQFLKDLGGQVIGKKIGTIEDQEYIITVVLAKGQNGNKCYYILTWDIRDFSKMSTQLNWNEKIEKLIPNDENHQKSLVLNIKFVDNLIIEYEKLYDDL